MWWCAWFMMCGSWMFHFSIIFKYCPTNWVTCNLTSVACVGDAYTSWLPAVAYGSCCLLHRRHFLSLHLHHFVDCIKKSLRVGGRISSVSLVYMDLSNLFFHCSFPMLFFLVPYLFQLLRMWAVFLKWRHRITKFRRLKF